MCRIFHLMELNLRKFRVEMRRSFTGHDQNWDKKKIKLRISRNLPAKLQDAFRFCLDATKFEFIPRSISKCRNIVQYTNRKERKLFPFSFYKFRVCASERALCLFMEPNTHPVLFTIVWLILLSAFCGSQIIYTKQTEMSIYIWQRRRRWKNIKTYIYFVTYVFYIASGFFFCKRTCNLHGANIHVCLLPLLLLRLLLP